MKLSIRALNILFSIAFLVLISTFFYSYMNLQGLRSANQWVDHTNTVLLHLERIYADVKDAESGVRGYVITGDGTHLESYYGAHKDVKNQLTTLHTLTSDNKTQQLLLDTLQNQLKERFSTLNKLVSISNNNADQEEISAIVLQGKTTMNEISLLIDELKQNERILLIQRNQVASQLNNSAPPLIIISGLLGFIILGASYIFIFLDFQSRIVIGKELKKKNILLEYAQQITHMGTFEYIFSENKNIWSNEMYEIFDLPKDTPPESSLIDSLILEDSEKIQKKREEIYEKMGNYSREFKIRTHAGKEKILLSNGYVNVDGNNKPFSLTGAIIDITDLKMAEINALEKEQFMRQAKERAESASQFKTRFLSNMSHEIRTPINAILGFTRILQKQNLTKEQKEHLKNISISGELLLKLIGNILDISKIEEGKVILNHKVFHLKENIRSSINPFKHIAAEKGLQFHLSIDENIPDYLIGDSSRISQILINLIGNAIKFTSKGDISVSIVLADSNAERCTVEFSITDTGIGIDPANQKYIFESFTQADESIQVQYGGSGLGLSIVREIVRLMGSEIYITSPVYNTSQSEGYGSRFHFDLTFDLSDTKSEDHLNKYVQILPFSSPVHILVAEDNEMNQILAAFTLNALGCTYEIVENGDLAVRLLSEKLFDLVLMDVQMPVCDGIQATKRIREHNTSIPIIGLTANVFQQEVDICLDAGMNDHMGKPYTEEQLYSSIKKWLFTNEQYLFAPLVSYCNFDFIESITNNNTSAFREMLDTFLSQNTKLAIEIDNALLNSDMQNLSFSLHQYKSCVRILGIEKQTSLILEIEKKIRAGYSFDALNHQIKNLIEIAHAVDNEITFKIKSI